MAVTQLDKNSEKTRAFSRVIEANVVSPLAPFHWLYLAIKDFMKAPLISLTYGVLFSAIPISIYYLVLLTENHLIILPSIVAFSLIGPAFSSGLYDVAWELEKGHKPTFKHSLKSMFRNPVGEWGFAILLLVILIAWMRIAALIHVLYPSHADPTVEELVSFLAFGISAGATIAAVVFTLSAFTPQIMVERRVDIMTAISTSVKAVNVNAITMFIWALIIVVMVAISVLTLGFGFIITMPILALASWHAYIAVIKTKRKRAYQ